MPETQQEILRLSRDVESGRAVYMQLLNRQQELNIAKSSAIGNVRIIDDAITQPKPVKPKGIGCNHWFSSRIYDICRACTYKSISEKRIESPEQLEEIGISVYASIPVSESFTKKINNSNKVKNVKAAEYQGFLALDNPADIALEAIRGLRTSLHFAMMDAKNDILMISGASPNAGKTFVSTNLAAVTAQTNKKVLFIDADMRKGYTHKLFNVNNDNGLSDYLSGRVDTEKCIKAISAGFDFISRGAVPPNPTELLMNSRLEKLLDWAKDNYELVIVDTPPILAVTDAAIIGRHVGTTLLVARFELNTPKEIEVSLRRFDNSGVHINGCILNGVMKKQVVTMVMATIIMGILILIRIN
jgi:tyrosine-protein kinase Etk/Wzc